MTNIFTIVCVLIMVLLVVSFLFLLAFNQYVKVKTSKKNGNDKRYPLEEDDDDQEYIIVRRKKK